MDRSGFSQTEPAGANDFLDLLHGQLPHLFGSRCLGEQMGSHLIDAYICALRREEHGNEKGVRISMR